MPSPPPRRPPTLERDPATSTPARGARLGLTESTVHMSIISWILLGLISGFIASKVVNGSGEGLFMDLALGVVGAFVGGGLFHFFGQVGITGLNLWSLLVSVVGAVVILVGYHALTGRRSRA